MEPGPLIVIFLGGAMALADWFTARDPETMERRQRELQARWKKLNEWHRKNELPRK
jgi:hypothetical protein